MTFDFEKVPSRRNTGSLKYDFALERGRPENALPLWVADMDFPTAPCVQEALERAVKHGIFGYSEPLEGYYKALAKWFSSRYGYEFQQEWLVLTPGVVFALAAVVRCLTEPGDGVLILTPVYYPFYQVVRDNGRTLVESPLRRENGRYVIDFNDMEHKLQMGNVRLLLFCSPHNPVGRVWTRQELERLGDLCEQYDIKVVSDEIHCDFTWPGHSHIPLPTVSRALKKRTVLCTAPTKTFNLAGLQISNIFIEDPALRKRFQAEVARTGYSQANSLGLKACEAAYRDGEDWLEALKDYLWGNLTWLRDAVQQIPNLAMQAPEGTYLAWLDCAGLGLDSLELEDLILNRAGLWLDSGSLFGKDCSQFERINVACPRKTLEQAVNQLKRAIQAKEAFL